MSRVIRMVPLVAVCVLIIAAPPVWANWIPDGVALCTAIGNQVRPAVTSDGAGGAIVTWYDYRNGNSDVFAQRVTAQGTVNWTTDGIAICTAPGDQVRPSIVSDGAGGAIITWKDYRNGIWNIYAQRVNGGGSCPVGDGWRGPLHGSGNAE